MQVSITWTEEAEFIETIDVNEETVERMEEDGIDMTDPHEVFEYLHDNGDLEGYDAQEYSSPKLKSLTVKG